MTHKLVFQALIVLVFPVTLELINTYFVKVTYGTIPFGGFLDNLMFYALIGTLIAVILYTIILSVLIRPKSLWNSFSIILLGLVLHMIYLLVKHDFYLDYRLIGTVYVISLIVGVLLSYILMLIGKNQRIDNKADVLDN